MIRVGIAGIGVIAKTYLDLMNKGMVPKLTVTALCSRNQAKTEALCKEMNLSAALFTNYEEMLRSGTIDAVLVATPHGLHPSMTKQALEAGLHVLTEKPVGISVEEVQQVVSLSQSLPQQVCGVFYNRRASSCYSFIKSLMSQGTLGEPVRCTWIITDLYRPDRYYQSSSWRGSWQQEGGGLLMTQASHQLDLLQWICGMPTEVLARYDTVNRSIQVENEAELLLTFANGAHGQFIASAHECPGTNRLEICGTRASLSVENDSTLTLTRLLQDEPLFARTATGMFDKVPQQVEEFSFDDADNGVQQAKTLCNFADAILGHAPVQCSLEEGLHSLRIIQGAYQSCRTGKPISLA